MQITTKAIVLHSIKYKDDSLIVKCYTQKRGVQSYLLKGILNPGKKKLKAAYFQPLTQLEIVATDRNKESPEFIRDVGITYPYLSLHTDILKSSIVIFLSEVLHGALREEDANPNLYTYIETSLKWLDTHDKNANFHLLFLINLSKYLGFYPDLSNSEAAYFDLAEGVFSNDKPPWPGINGEDLKQFKKILGINFDALYNVKYNTKDRATVLNTLLYYFELHLEGFKKTKSLTILKTLFH